MSRPIPPLNPLHVFEVAARLGSFAEAAEELGVTQSAVSRQVAVLEGYLGQPLFIRGRRGVTLTPAGEGYRQAVAPAFQAIAQATQRLRQAKEEAPLRLRVYATFAAKWLLHRLPGFQAAHPEVQVKLSHTVAPVDFRGRDREVDLAIQFGRGAWPGLHRRLLLPDVIQPVCAPNLLQGKLPLRQPTDLARHRLLISRYRRDDWRDWLVAIGLPDLPRNGMEFTSSVLTYQAAEAGLGVAMGQIHLLGPEIAAGSLVPLFERPLERPLGHYVVWPMDRPPSRNARAFLAWLLQQIEGQPGGTPG